MPPSKRTRPAARTTDLPFPLSLLLYGPSGSGKTSFACRFPRCGIICDSQEKGASFLLRRGLIPKPTWIETDYDVDDHRTWQKLLKRIWEVPLDNKVDTLVIESITGFENVCFLSHCEEKFRGNWDGSSNGGGFFDYAKGPKSAARLAWPKLIAALDAVLEAGKHVVVTAHTTTKEEDDPTGVRVLKFVPYCDKDVWARIHRWASGVFFLGKRIEEDTQNRGLRKTAKPDFDRLLYVEGTPYCEAKNWLGLEGVISMGNSPSEGFENFLKKLNK